MKKTKKTSRNSGRCLPLPSLAGSAICAVCDGDGIGEADDITPSGDIRQVSVPCRYCDGTGYTRKTPTPPANNAAGAGCMAQIVRQSLQDWIDSGQGDECFWEAWPECPTEIELTPNMILAVLNSLPNAKRIHPPQGSSPSSGSGAVGYWTPVTEKMPEDEITVLVWSEGLDDATLACHDSAELENRGGADNPYASGWIMHGTTRVLLGVTHWCADICPPNNAKRIRATD